MTQLTFKKITQLNVSLILVLVYEREVEHIDLSHL